MPQITSNTQIDTINILSEANSFDNSDLLFIQRGSTSYKLKKENLIIPKEQIAPISSLKVLGNISGSSAAPSEITVDTDLSGSFTNHNSIPSSKAVKDFLFRPEFVSITGVSGVSGTGDLSSVTGLSYDSGYSTKSGSITYIIDNFTGGVNLNTNNIVDIHIVADVRMSASITSRESNMSVTYPDGSSQPLLYTDFETNQNETNNWIKLVVRVPINSDTTSFTINLNVNDNTGGERAAYEIIGATVLTSN